MILSRCIPSDPLTVYLSAMARMRQPSIAAVEQALYADRSLIRHHAMRRTLWVATPAVVRQMHAAATRKLVAPEHKRVAGLLVQSGIDDPDAWLAQAREQILAYLATTGPPRPGPWGSRSRPSGSRCCWPPGRGGRQPSRPIPGC